MKTIRRNVMINLAEEEKIQYGKVAGELNAKLDDTVVAFEHLRKDWKGKIEALQNELHIVLGALRTGQIEKEVECKIDYDKAMKTVRYLYKGEVVEERPLTDEDRQMEIA